MKDLKTKALEKKKVDRSPIRLGEGSLKERRYQAERANKDMRRQKTFYTAANHRAGLA